MNDNMEKSTQCDVVAILIFASTPYPKQFVMKLQDKLYQMQTKKKYYMR